MKRVFLLVALCCGLSQLCFGTTYHVSTTGNDTSGDGSSGKPWKTLKFAVSRVPANQGHTIKLASGTFIEQGPIDVPTRVNIEGSGKSTVLRAVSSFYFYPLTPRYGEDKYLIRFISDSPTNGGQSIKNLTINGDGKKLHGGVLFQNRDNILVEGLRFEYINFNGLWLWKSKNSRITNCEFLNCAWASSAWCSGALQLGDLENVEVDRVKVDEGRGYGIKSLQFGATAYAKLANVKIHDCHLTVNPYSPWNTGEHGNMTVEFWNTHLSNVEFYNNYLDNILSIVSNFKDQVSRRMWVHHNVFDLTSRSKGEGYSIELTCDDVEINHNFFNTGAQGISNWGHDARKNWNIHHNIFYGLKGYWPSQALRANSPISNIKFNNNTFESTGIKTANVIGLYEGPSANIEVKNNLFIDSNTSYEYYTNKLVHLQGGATIQNLQVSNNFFDKFEIGNVPGSYSNNISVGNPQINASGNRPDPYYRPKTGSPLIAKGIGAYASGSTSSPSTTPSPNVGSNTIVIRARGLNGSERIQLQVNNTAVATWTLTTTMANYTATTSASGNVRVQFINDASGRDVQVDYVQVNGGTRQAEDQVTNTATCGGSGKSEWMRCNGYIDFGNAGSTVTSTPPTTPPPSGGSNTIVVRARGTAGSESIQLQVNNTTIASWTLTTAMANYTATTSSSGNIRVQYTNDASGRDVQVDYIQVNGSNRQAEDQATNTGQCGSIKKSEWMYCNGYIDFGSIGSTVISTPPTTPPPTTPPPSGGSNTIVVRARGISGSESIQLQVNNTTIANWTLTTAMANYTATTSSSGNIRVQYTNDASGRDVQVDYIQVNGSNRQAEDQATNTGQCGSIKKSEWMYCNGYIDFGSIGSTVISTPPTTPPPTTPPPSGGSNTIVVRARGISGSESIQLQVNNTTIANWKLTTTMANYTATTSSSGNIRVQYTNDASGRDVQVDYIQVNGSSRQAEDQSTNTGHCGSIKKSEWMYCNGYIDFGQMGNGLANSSARISTSSEELTIDELESKKSEMNELLGDNGWLRFVNPVRDGILRMEFDQYVSEINIVDLNGRILRVFKPQHQGKLNEELVLLPGMYIVQPVENGVRKKPERLVVE